MPSRTPSRLTAPLGLALAGLLVLVAQPDPAEAGRPTWSRLGARADTDSVALPRLGVEGDTLDLDSLVTQRADTTDSTARARVYFAQPIRTPSGVALAARERPGIRGRLGDYWRRDIALDTAAYRYRVREIVGQDDVRAPADVTLSEFLAARRQAALGETFRELAAQRADRQARRGRGGFGFAVDVPGGEQSAFRTIFGKNEVALTVNGTSNVNLGMRYNQNEQRASVQGDGSTLNPDFGQELNLNVAGTIGDKLTVNVNYDTQSTFDFENQVSLVYEGYEDDIVQRIEAGNVFLQTPATLIRGGQRLFGLRTDLQFGPLALTAVASQQDGQSTDVVIEGGQNVQGYDLAPFEYENNQHFFLGYAFHNWWDAGHRVPSLVSLHPEYGELVDIEVWKHEPGLVSATTDDIETTWAIALADLGEPTPDSPQNPDGLNVLQGGQEYLGPFDGDRYDPSLGLYGYENAVAPLPNPARDQYTEAELDAVRQNGATVNADNPTLFGAVDGSTTLPTGAFANNKFRRLRENIDYTVDGNYGWLSLTAPLSQSEQLAVAYVYRDRDGNEVTIGDYRDPAQTDSQTGARTILKLLRSDRPVPTDPLWDLTLRNVYRVGGRSLTPQSFDLGITFEPSGLTASTDPRDLSFEGKTFLEVLGLDRVNGQNSPTPDTRFDFLPGFTVDPANGRVVFPVRQPFGDYLENLIRTGRTVSGELINVTLGSLPDVTAAFEQYVPRDADDGGRGPGLYDLDPNRAQQKIPELTRFQIAGEFKSASQSTFNVGFQLVEGTVRVTANDIELTEGADYRVNYTAGTVDVIEPRYLQDGQRIRVSVEQNQLFQIGSKTLLGLRADYRLDEDARLGATWMRLAERPLDEKPAIGREALNNTILGLDGSYTAEPRWLTRAVDALPLLQTRAPSRFEIRGEVARLNPGHPTTTAFDRTRDALRDDGYDFDPDELAGISYIDAFENSENAYTALSLTGGWRIAAPPDSAGPADGFTPLSADPDEIDVTNPLFQSNWRGLFAWYSITRTGYRGFNELGVPSTFATQPIPLEDLFPERARTLEPNQRALPVDLLDLYFDPTRRGPYNFNGELETTFIDRPQEVWGGFIRQVDGSYSDFDGRNNVEFIEVLFSPLGGRDGTQPIAPEAKLFIDLGRLNEDVLPNGGFTNSEDGLRDGEVRNPDTDLDAFSRRPTEQTNGVIDLFRDTGRNEDLGLDGIASYPRLINLDADNQTPYPIDEVSYFQSFWERLTPGSPEYIRATDIDAGYADPSGDDYRYFLDNSGYFEDPRIFPDGPASVQERYAHYLPAFELNSTSARREVGLANGIATLPNSEDINGNSRADVVDQFHRYEIPLTDAELRASPFFVNTLETQAEGQPQQSWYLLRIPVRTDIRTTKGLDRDDFSRIEAVRMWTQGHDKPATIRLATFELVGSQWLKSDRVGFVDEGREGVPAGVPELFIASVNNEENDEIYAIPRGTVQKLNRSFTGPARPTREESIVFRAEDLVEGRRAGISKTYATNPIDLTKYDRLRMEVHGHGFERSDSLRVFVRIGDNETDDYYEIEQPVYPYDPDDLADLGLGPGTCPTERPSNCARADSLWQTNVRVNGEIVDLNPVNVDLSAFNRAKLARDLAGIDPAAAYTVPGTPEGSPRGARVTVRGQPSIQDVRTIVLGIKNGVGGQMTPLDTVTVWFNELRVTGYDEAGGASGFVTADLALADVARVNARMSFTDDGFGELGGALGAREFASTTGFTLTSSLSAHKLLPERFGWSIPVSLSVTENTSTPRFDPDNGDIRLDELIETVEAEGSTAPEAVTAEAVLDRAQTTSRSRNVRVSASKSGSRSPWLRYTIDGITASYSASEQEGSNPRTALTASDSWSGDLSYRVTVPRPLTVKPLWFTRPVPILGLLGGLQLNVLPQGVTLRADARRSVSATQQRLAADLLSEPEEVRAFRAPVRRSHRFDHGRQFDLTYNPLSFLRLTYASNTDQDFGAAGQVERDRALVRDAETGFSQTFDLSPTAARRDEGVRAALDAAGLIDTTGAVLSRVEFLGGPELEVLPLGEALGGIFGGEARTRAYTQRLTGALRVSTRRAKWISWIQPQSISYSGDYRWNDQPIPTSPDLDVASARTTTSFESGLKLVPRDFWRLFPFYRRIEAAGDQASGQPAAADSSGGGFDPARLVVGAARGAFLAVTGIDDVTVRYRGSLSAAAGGLAGQSYSTLSGLRGAAPPIAFRLGLERRLDIDRRIADPNALLTFNDALGEQHELDARTTFQPLRGLSISLNGQTSWGQTERITFQVQDDATLDRGIPNRGGNGESTVFSFGGAYEAFVERHAERLLRDIGSAVPGQQVASEFGSPTGLAADFRDEFGRGAGVFGPNGLLQIPLPNWTVSYSGLERLPLVNRIAQQVSLQHGYSSTNQMDYATAILGLDATDTVTLPSGSFTLASEAVGAGGFDEPTSLTVNERFQPLIGVNVGWKGGLQTSLTFNRSRTYTLQASSAQFQEKNVRDIRVDVSYAKTGLRLLGLRRLNNNLRLTLTGVLSDNVDTRRTPLGDTGDVLSLIRGEPLVDPTEILTTRFQLSPRVSYTVSNQVTADVFVRYERVFTQGTQASSNRSVDGGVNLRILFSN